MGKLKRLAFAKQPKFFIPLILVMAIAVVIVSVINNMNQPAVGSISQTPSTDVIKADPYAKPGRYDGKYVSFAYPAHFKALSSKLSGSTLELAEFHTTDSTGKQISVAVYAGSINNDSAITYRRQAKPQYTENDSRIGIEFIKSDGTEDTFFISHNNLMASVSVTAPYNNQAGDALFVASGLKWKQ